ncbi:AraC family transcriptional regulator [Amorphus orientalis]|uniref:AraC-like DNA-binding protein n=1 Tax=Amorphus orientalis TaxID=649198 RepID=A0AAE3VSY1_9HYPH|nr:AraC family transcriptional regulator [Amorphus orientalis]MDQ0317016.1 AraC-like DNA-binding protein [Amorphus orientalis]
MKDQVRYGGGAAGIERAEIVLVREAYSPHRHDTYALGMTLGGVQAFDYRGAARASVEGNVFVLHPDEVHDGHPGTEAGLAYRALYVAPHLIADALGGGALPFLAEPVSADPRLVRAMRTAMAGFDDAIGEIQATEIVTTLADALAAIARPGAPSAPVRTNRPAMERVAALIDGEPAENVGIAEMEGVSGHDRWTLFRQFPAVYGVSPYRYAVMRRLDRARGLIRAGSSLADAAAAAGFSDQSHLTRQFRATYGFSPGRWRRMVTGQ